MSMTPGEARRIMDMLTTICHCIRKLEDAFKFQQEGDKDAANAAHIDCVDTRKDLEENIKYISDLLRLAT